MTELVAWQPAVAGGPWGGSTQAPRTRIGGGRWLAVAAAWGVAVAIALATAAFTRIGPVVYVFNARHGVHEGDVVVAAAMFCVAALVTAGLLRPRRRAEAGVGTTAAPAEWARPATLPTRALPATPPGGQRRPRHPVGAAGPRPPQPPARPVRRPPVDGGWSPPDVDPLRTRPRSLDPYPVPGRRPTPPPGPRWQRPPAQPVPPPRQTERPGIPTVVLPRPSGAARTT